MRGLQFIFWPSCLILSKYPFLGAIDIDDQDNGLTKRGPPPPPPPPPLGNQPQFDQGSIAFLPNTLSIEKQRGRGPPTQTLYF